MCCFELEEDAIRFFQKLKERLGKFNPELAEDKSKIITVLRIDTMHTSVTEPFIFCRSRLFVILPFCHVSLETPDWVYVQEVVRDHEIKWLVNLDILEDEVACILRSAGFQQYRLDGVLKWIMKTIQMLKEL